MTWDSLTRPRTPPRTPPARSRRPSATRPATRGSRPRARRTRPVRRPRRPARTSRTPSRAEVTRGQGQGQAQPLRTARLGGVEAALAAGAALREEEARGQREEVPLAVCCGTPWARL